MGICHSDNSDKLNKFNKYSYSYSSDISLNLVNKRERNKLTKLDIAIWESTVPGTTRHSSSFLIKITR